MNISNMIMLLIVLIIISLGILPMFIDNELLSYLLN